MTAKPRHLVDAPLLSPPAAHCLALGAIAFVAALTPSLIPRSGLFQGVVAGVAFASFYGLGALATRFWIWLGLPVPDDRTHWRIRAPALAAALAAVAYGLLRAPDWQNAIRDAMGMPAVESAHASIVAGVSLVVFLSLLLLVRLFRRAAVIGSTILARLLPTRAALLGGFLLAGALFWSVGNGVLLQTVLRALDDTYRQIDSFLPPALEAPADPRKSGSAASLLPWASLGAEGRNRVLAAPVMADIAELSPNGMAMEPLRVYVGANSAETPDDRAALALAELIRIGAFERSLLVIATPTGTGWVDPAAMAPVEALHRGDIASVSVQYSYLPSWLSLLVEPDYGAETAGAVFRVVYGHWRSLPKQKRPRLFLFGLSLGALNSDLSADFLDIIGNPYDGALWVGPPFASRTWRQITDARVSGSPAWLPRFRDGSLFRFTAQTNRLDDVAAPWGPMRIVYLQYASDPITFFETASLWRRPSWLQEPRGPDVSPAVRWTPVVTFLQLICDMMTATTTPRGTGHVYAGSHYLDGWIAVTAPQGWTAADVARLRAWLAVNEL
jgi:uncharacterized membrane protein